MLRAEEFMEEALREAAADENEVPVGAVVVYQGRVIARAHNEREANHPFAHAEMLAMERACQALGNRRLHGCTLYVTLEPCPMCAGALMMAQIIPTFLDICFIHTSLFFPANREVIADDIMTQVRILRKHFSKIKRDCYILFILFLHF